MIIPKILAPHGPVPAPFTEVLITKITSVSPSMVFFAVDDFSKLEDSGLLFCGCFLRTVWLHKHTISYHSKMNRTANW